MEIEEPFGEDPNDLPLEDYCLAIERVLLDILKRALRPGATPGFALAHMPPPAVSAAPPAPARLSDVLDHDERGVD